MQEQNRLLNENQWQTEHFTLELLFKKGRSYGAAIKAVTLYITLHCSRMMTGNALPFLN